MSKTSEQIKQEVVNQLTWDSRVDSTNVDVDVSDGGIVTLSGQVSSYTAMDAAEEVAFYVGGVTVVNNELTVEFPTAFTVPSDSEIKDTVEQILAWNADVNATDIIVSVDSGVVTLAGAVSSFWEKRSAEASIERAAGVIDVVSKLVVAPTGDLTDEVIGERVMDRIEQNTMVDLSNINVKVSNGEVTLSGTVPSWPAWRSVFDAAQYTMGVSDVVDNLQISYINLGA